MPLKSTPSNPATPSPADHHGSDRHGSEHARFTVDPMYSSVTVTLPSETHAEGHIYEVSLDGMRFELDEALPLGARVSVAMTLPGCPAAICAHGRVSHVFDAADDPAARRMVVEFETFRAGARSTLERYLDQKWLRPAPVGTDLAGNAVTAEILASDSDVQQTCEVMIETNDSGSTSSKRRKSASAA
jgi:hypothetical protein